MFTKYIYINIAVFINLHAAKSAVHTAKLGQYCLGGGGSKKSKAFAWGAKIIYGRYLGGGGSYLLSVL